MDYEAYLEGRNASVACDGDVAKHKGNPYEKDTVKWLSYNYGWNTHYDEAWLSDKKKEAIIKP